MNRNVLFGTATAMLLSAGGLASEVAIKMKDLPTAVRRPSKSRAKVRPFTGLSKKWRVRLTLKRTEVNGRNKDVLIDDRSCRGD